MAGLGDGADGLVPFPQQGIPSPKQGIPETVSDGFVVGVGAASQGGTTGMYSPRGCQRLMDVLAAGLPAFGGSRLEAGGGSGRKVEVSMDELAVGRAAMAVELLDPGGYYGVIPCSFVELVCLMQGGRCLAIKKIGAEAKNGGGGAVSIAANMGVFGGKRRRKRVDMAEENEELDGVGEEFPDPTMG